MNHNLYETWLFTDKPLLPVEQAELRQHLETCEHCRQLDEGRKGFERQLQRASMVSPAAGFSRRWKTRLENVQQREQRQQSLALLGLSLGAVVIIVFSFIIHNLPVLRNPSLVFWTYVYQLLSLTKVADFFENTLKVIYLFIRRDFNLSWAIGFSPLWISLWVSGLFALVLGWCLSIRKLTLPREKLRVVKTI